VLSCAGFSEGAGLKNLFDVSATDEVVSRIDRLQASTPRQWGKMDAAQMMAHCSAALDMASGKFVASRSLLGRIIGPRLRHILTDDKPMKHNNATAKELTVGTCDFAREHQRLKECVRQFRQGGEAGCTEHPHPFFGPLTPLEWATGMYKHLDHHLRQFGV